MSKLGCIVYCNKEARKWEVKPSEGCITFVMCWEDGKAVALRSEEDIDLVDTVVFKPRPYVNNKLVHHDKLVAYPFAQLKDFVHAVGWKDDWGEGQLVTDKDVKPKEKKEKSPVSPRRHKEKKDEKKDDKADKKKDDGSSVKKSTSKKEKDAGSISPRKHHHEEKKLEKSATSRAPAEEKKEERREERKEERKREERPSEPEAAMLPAEPRKINVDLNKKDTPPPTGAAIVMANAEGLELDATTLAFLSERYQKPLTLKLAPEAALEPSEKNALNFLEQDIANLKKSVASFKGPSKDKMKASPFTEAGLNQYYGVEADDGDLYVPPPYISLQGLDEIFGDATVATSPRVSQSDTLIWTSGSALGMSKKVWYQLLGRTDDGQLSDESVSFFKELQRAAKTTLALDSDDRASVAKAAVEAMDKVAPIDPRIKKRLLEQAQNASVGGGRKKVERVKSSKSKK